MLYSMNTDALQSLGIPEKTAKIYMATLSLGTAPVQQIAKAAGMKRPAAYFHIDELLQEGLLEKITIGKKEYYRASDPRILEKRAQKNLATIQEAIPQFETVRNTTSGRPTVRTLEGEKGLNIVYEEIMQANSIRFWADLVSFEKEFREAFQGLSAAIAQRQIRTREIIPDTAEARKSSKRYAAVAGKYYSSRIATHGPIYNDSAIYGNTVAFFRIQECNLFVVLIEDASIAATMKTIFDMAWNSAEPYIPTKKTT